ncbi:MAG: HAMP domain-containing sensor histidine kinase [bacterium]
MRLRWLAVAGVLVTLSGALLLGVRFRPGPALAVAAAITLYNGLFWLWLRRSGRAGGERRMAEWQVAVDIFALVLLLYFTGGIENPFSYYLVFHAAIAGVMLPGRRSWPVAALAFVLYGSMVVLDHLGVIPHFALDGPFRAAPYRDGRYLLASLFGTGVAFGISAYFTAAISRQLSRRARELAGANERLRRADRQRLESVIMVTHELRAPMAAVDSLLETVTGGYVHKSCDVCGALPMVERARARVRGLLKLTNDVLDLHKLELGEAELRRLPVALGPLAERVVEQYTELAAQAGVTVRLAAASAMPAALGDEQSIWFILSNLVANAVKYNRPGGSVAVSAVRSDRGGDGREQAMVDVRVTDTGVGIPAADLPMVFEIFYRGTYARPEAGSGLGLSLVKRLVEAQGGRVWVKSEQGAGSEFGFALPAAG